MSGARQAEGHQPRSHRAPQESDKNSSNLALFWVVKSGWVSFSPSFFHFFWGQTSFIVRSQIGGELVHKTAMFEIATPWKRIKHCPNLNGEKKKKKGCPISKKPRMSDLKMGRRMDFKPWCSDCPRPRDAENRVRCQKNWKKRKIGMSDLKKSEDVRSQIERQYGHHT